jgi:hypothetical protein
MTNHAPTIQSVDEIDLAAKSLRKMVQSNVISVEDNMIDKMSQGAEKILDVLNDLPKPCQKELLLGYRRLLQCSIDYVNEKAANVLFR